MPLRQPSLDLHYTLLQLHCSEDCACPQEKLFFFPHFKGENEREVRQVSLEGIFSGKSHPSAVFSNSPSLMLIQTTS